MKSKRFGRRLGRRGFLKGTAALVGGLTTGMAGTASAQENGTKLINYSQIRPVGEVSRFERKMVRRGSASVGLTPLQDLQGIITPSDLHFYENHENGIIPDIDPKEHRLLIHGMVDRPVELTMDEIKSLPSVSRICFVECGSNSNNIFDKKAETAQDIHGKTSWWEWARGAM